jgi:hypothetical protein
MTRRMADSVTVADLPEGFDVYGCYDDGLYNNAAACKARFPDKTILIFTVFAQDEIGDCLDVEDGDATPAEAPGWISRRRQAGHPGPLVYCSESLWATVRAQFLAQHVPEPGYIVAGYPGSAGPAGMYPPPAVGHQWIDRGPYDESVLVDYLPGIDPAPDPPQSPGDDMIASTPSGNGYWICKPDGSIWSFGDAQWLGAMNWPTNVLVPGDTITGFTSHPTTPGYWISTDKGSVYAYGAATWHGNLP